MLPVHFYCFIFWPENVTVALVLISQIRPTKFLSEGVKTWAASCSPALHSVVGVPAQWWSSPSGNAQSVLSHSCCHHLSQYFTVLWTRPALELPDSLWSFFGNISQHFIYNLRARPAPHCGRCAHTEYSMNQAYQLTDFKKSKNACVVAVVHESVCTAY